MRTQITYCIFIVFALFVLSACEQQERETAQEREQEAREMTKAVMVTPAENRATLLAIKYGIPEESIDQIISDYLHTHDMGYRLMVYTIDRDKNPDTEQFSYAPGESVIDTVNRLSSSTGVEPQKIASVIVDYEMWVEASAIRDY